MICLQLNLIGSSVFKRLWKRTIFFHSFCAQIVIVRTSIFFCCFWIVYDVRSMCWSHTLQHKVRVKSLFLSVFFYFEFIDIERKYNQRNYYIFMQIFTRSHLLTNALRRMLSIAVINLSPKCSHASYAPLQCDLHCSSNSFSAHNFPNIFINYRF